MSTVPLVIAAPDARLSARLVARRALPSVRFPGAGAEPPARVRAGSGLAWFQGRLAVIQDDARFLALIEPGGASGDALALTSDAPGVLGGPDLKSEKLDLEALTAVALEGGPGLLALGSGSTPARERMALVTMVPGGIPEAHGPRLIAAPAFYAALREAVAFAGSELNLEGALALPTGDLLLAQRGNGAARGAWNPADALAAIALAPLLAALLAGEAPPPPTLRDVVRYDLGALGGVRLTFTDLCAGPGPSAGLLYVAVGEDSPDAYRDGPVAGTALGVLDGGEARWAPLFDARGDLVTVKAEGVALDPEDPSRALLVTDPDDASAPAELLEVALAGPWW